MLMKTLAALLASAALAGAAPMPGELPELNVPAELDPHVKPAPDPEDDE
ncbi:MAG: hypothetical protein HC838_16800 [Spirulinaceae cyanobacterium RM2_2_10]|nr:hypothetical protein [Spirulinaceae cyanobacterium RM2_2_10]